MKCFSNSFRNNPYMFTENRSNTQSKAVCFIMLLNQLYIKRVGAYMPTSILVIITGNTGSLKTKFGHFSWNLVETNFLKRMFGPHPRSDPSKFKKSRKSCHQYFLILSSFYVKFCVALLLFCVFTFLLLFCFFYCLFFGQ